MSLAIPSSYSEYLFDQNTRLFTPQMICNGAIMPYRTYNSSSTNYVNALRGEDIFFLMEAIWMRYNFATYDYTLGTHLGEGIDNEIRANRLSDMRNAVMGMRLKKWQFAKPTVYSHDFGATMPDTDDNEVEEYMFSAFSNFKPACQFDTSYYDLRSSNILNLMKDVKTMTYGVDATHQIYPSITTGSHNHWTINNNGRITTEDEDVTALLESDEQYDYYNNRLTHSSTCASSNNSLSAQIYQQDNWIMVADIKPYVLFNVWNVWSWYNNTTGDHDGGTPDEHYVLVPITEDFVDVSNGGQIQGLRSASDIIDDAFTTAGLQRNAQDIQLGSTPIRQGEWGYRKIAFASLASYYTTSLIHVKYCNLENTNL